MRRCVKCGHEDWGSIHYCPKCGTLFPGEKEMILVGEEDYRQATKVFDCVEVETKKWNEMESFYESHLSTGYAPQGKQLIAKSELAQLRKNSMEYEQAVKANGKYAYSSSIRCNVTQRHQKKINHVGFEVFWKTFYQKESWIFWFFYALVISYMILGFTLFIVLTKEFGGWGALATVILAIPFIAGGLYIASDILD